MYWGKYHTCLPRTYSSPGICARPALDVEHWASWAFRLPQYTQYRFLGERKTSLMHFRVNEACPPPLRVILALTISPDYSLLPNKTGFQFVVKSALTIMAWQNLEILIFYPDKLPSIANLNYQQTPSLVVSHLYSLAN